MGKGACLVIRGTFGEEEGAFLVIRGTFGEGTFWLFLTTVITKTRKRGNKKCM